MSPEKEHLESSLIRHGIVADIGETIERGEKPPYEEFIKFMEGEIDPSIDEEATKRLIEKLQEEKKLKEDDFNIIVCSPATRAKQTAELIRKILNPAVEIRSSRGLREVKIPMTNITPEFYSQAANIHEIRKKCLDSFLEGGKIDEDVVKVFRRATTIINYFRKIRKFTDKKPLFIGHGLFPRFLELAIKHQGEKLNDEEIREIIKREFSTTKRPGVLEGSKISSSEEGIKILNL